MNKDTKDTVMLAENKSLELKKHVAIIHSNNRISLLQRKISNALLFHAYDYLLIKEEHEIHISTLTKLIGYDSHDHKRIKQALMDLLATVVEWNIVDGDKLDQNGIWNASSIIADASINGSKCTYSYSNKMRQLLYHPSIYGRLCMKVQAKFQSGYGLALYENCNRYQDIGQTPWFELSKFRKLMGVDDNKYKIFRDFKSRVLDKSIEEVNKYSPLMIESKVKKENRQVSAIQFLIKKEKNHKYTMEEGDKQSLLNILIQTYGLSKKQQLEVLEKYEEEYILEKIRLIETSNSYISGKIKNLAKYLLCALKDDYQQVNNIRSNKESKKNEIDNIKDEQLTRNKVLKVIEENSEKSIEYLYRFEQYIKGTGFEKIYQKEKLDNKLIQDHFIKYMINQNK